MSYVKLKNRIKKKKQFKWRNLVEADDDDDDDDDDDARLGLKLF